jgi:predicted negative regulator of RcsB-dependent stress response
VEWLEKAVELAPYDPVINDHLGDALWMVGRRLEAEFQWQYALDSKPTDKDAAKIRQKLKEGLPEVDGNKAPPTADGGDKPNKS